MSRLIGPRYCWMVLLSWWLSAAEARLWSQEARPSLQLPITKIADARNLPREDAAQKHPVQLRCVVTYCQTEKGSFTADDGTSIWFRRDDFTRMVSETNDVKLTVGDHIEVEGVVATGHYAPLIIPYRISLIGRKPLPEPIKATFSEIQSGLLDTQRVMLNGVVHAAEKTAFSGVPCRALTVATLGGKFTFMMLAEVPHANEALVDAEVIVTGVCIPIFNSRGQLNEARLFASEANSLEIVRPAPSGPFSAPETKMNALLQFSPKYIPNNRLRTTGLVTASVPGRFFYLMEDRRGLRVETTDRTRLRVGDIVECAGFMQMREQFPVMNHAVFRVLRHEGPPTPKPVTLKQILSVRVGSSEDFIEDFDARLISIQGTLSSVEQGNEEGFRLYVKVEDKLVPVSLAEGQSSESLNSLRLGSELKIHGIATVQFSQNVRLGVTPSPVSISMLLRDANDVRVVKLAPWWTPRRLMMALAIALGTLLLALAWAVILRKQVRDRSLELAEEMRARRDAEVEFDATLRERERLAADLHDTLEQTLTGVALQIHATRTAPNPAGAERNLDLATQMLSRSREEVRRSVWNLRAHALEGCLLREALEDICTGILVDSGIAVTVGGVGEEEVLSEFVTGNLLLLAKEAVTNAIKHAQPTKISIQVDYTNSDVCLTVTDDGKGFDPQNVCGPHQGHFGLTGMRERAKRMGGKMSVTSHPGKGTSISMQVADCIRR
jgi:signal transduction histidine kinase